MVNNLLKAQNRWNMKNKAGLEVVIVHQKS